MMLHILSEVDTDYMLYIPDANRLVVSNDFL